MRHSKRKQRQHRRKVAAVVVALLVLAIGGGWLNWLAWSAHICATVPNHYTCTEG